MERRRPDFERARKHKLPPAFEQQRRHPAPPDYYLLLTRLIADLKQNNSSTRRALYGRAKRAQLRELMTLVPAITDAEFKNELSALNDTISHIENDFWSREKSEKRASRIAEASVSDQPADISSWKSRRPILWAAIGAAGCLLVVGLVAANFGAPPVKPANTGVSNQEFSPIALQAYQQILTDSVKGVDWINNLSGGATLIKRMAIGDKYFHSGTVCDPRNCANDQLSFLIAEDGSRATALLRSKGAPGGEFQSFGAPNDRELAILNYLSVK